MSTRLRRVERKVDAIFHLLKSPADATRYMTARQTGDYTGLDHRTILNRSNLPADDPRFIPSLRFGSRRKYFDRRVIDRLFRRGD